MTKNKSLPELEIELYTALEAVRKAKGELVKEIEYTLLEPIKYSYNGSSKETKQVILKAPKGKHIDLVGGFSENGLSGMLKLIGCGDIMFSKEDNTGMNYIEFNDVDIRVLNDLMSFYTRVFFPYS